MMRGAQDHAPQHKAHGCRPAIPNMWQKIFKNRRGKLRNFQQQLGGFWVEVIPSSSHAGIRQFDWGCAQKKMKQLGALAEMPS